MTKSKKRAKPRERLTKITLDLKSKDANIYKYYLMANSEEENHDHRHPRETRRIKDYKENEDGTISVTISADEKTERKELIKRLAEKLGKKVRSEDILADALGEATTNTLQELEKRLKKGTRIKPKEGCYHVDVGNMVIPIRD